MVRYVLAVRNSSHAHVPAGHTVALERRGAQGQPVTFAAGDEVEISLEADTAGISIIVAVNDEVVARAMLLNRTPPPSARFHLQIAGASVGPTGPVVVPGLHVELARPRRGRSGEADGSGMNDGEEQDGNESE